MYIPGFCGIGDDDLQIFAPGKFQYAFPVFVRIDAAADRGDHPLVIHLYAFFTPAEIQGIQAFLFVNQLRQSLGYGLHQHDLAVKSGFFIRDINEIVHKGAQEISFAELHHFFRSLFQNITIITCLFQYIIVQLIHLFTLQYGISILNLHRIPHHRQVPKAAVNPMSKKGKQPFAQGNSTFLARTYILWSKRISFSMIRRELRFTSTDGPSGRPEHGAVHRLRRSSSPMRSG